MSVSFANQLTPTNFPTNSRTVLDANFIASNTLPAAASTTVNGTSLDLQQTLPYATTEIVNVQISIPALNTTMLPDTRTLTVTLQDSPDNTNWTAVPEFSALVITGASGAGAAATSRIIKLTPASQRYIRVIYVTGASTATMAALSGTLQLLF